MTPHVIAALYLGAIGVGVLSGVVAYELRRTSDVMRRAPFPPVAQSNVRRIDSVRTVGGQR